MKGIWNLLIGLLLGGILGWALGFLRLPELGKGYSFGVGFLTCLALISFFLFSFKIWNKNAFFLNWIGQSKKTSEKDTPRKTYFSIWMLVAVFIALGGVASSILIFRQNSFLKSQAQNQVERIREQSELIESVRASNQAALMSNVLDKVDDELKTSSSGQLTDEVINRITALSYSLKPYRYFDGDSLIDQKLSPERGLLLLTLSKMGIDSNSFARIKSVTDFSYADLKGADLQGSDLSGATLRRANLNQANLNETNLNGVNLKEANLWGVKLNQAVLIGANLNRADLSWAEMNGCDLRFANLNGASLKNTQLRKANLKAATFNWGELEGAMLLEANLSEINFEGTNMEKANLSRANLSRANLKKVNLKEANLKNVTLILTTINVDNWFEKLAGWQTIGIEKVQESYKIVKDTSKRYKYVKFCLERVKR